MVFGVGLGGVVVDVVVVVVLLLPPFFLSISSHPYYHTPFFLYFPSPPFTFPHIPTL